MSSLPLHLPPPPTLPLFDPTPPPFSHPTHPTPWTQPPPSIFSAQAFPQTIPQPIYPAQPIQINTKPQDRPTLYIKPTPNLNPPPQIKPKHHHRKTLEVRGKPFRIDSKLFTLGFDGGRADPYHIMESKGHFQGSIWLGIKGLHWTIGELRKLKHVSPSRSGIFQFRRDGYRTLEFSCLSNRGGRFVELSEYHRGTQRGSIRIPEGRRGEGWALLMTEIQKYYLETESGKVPPKRDGKSRGRRATTPESQSSRNGRMLHNESRPLRRGDLHLAPKIQLRESRDLSHLKGVKDQVILSITEPRPTRSFNFQ